MYGFHKINRVRVPDFLSPLFRPAHEAPRSDTARTAHVDRPRRRGSFHIPSSCAGAPDLLDEIKRKALEPDPGVKHRVELPGEVSVP